MIRFFSFVVCSVLMLASCDSNVSSDMQELNLKNQLIGLESVKNARQLGGYVIGNKKIKDNLLIHTAKLSEMSEADSILLSDKFKLQCIYDFRGNDEVVSEPDVIPGNASYNSFLLSFSGGESQGYIEGEIFEIDNTRTINNL